MGQVSPLQTGLAQPPSSQAGVVIEPLGELVQHVIADLKTRTTTPELPTGIPKLDEGIWGIHRSELTVISARPGEGKSTLSLQIARHLADQGKKVLFLSLEMTRHQLCERLLVQITQTEAWLLRTGNPDAITKFLAQLEPLAGLWAKLNLHIVDGTGKTIEEVQHLLHLLCAEGGGPPDVMVIDHVQLARSDNPDHPRHEVIGRYVDELKDLAMRYNMAVIACSQLNRDGTTNKGGKPKLSNLKGSGQLEETGDCVILCWWEKLGTEEAPTGIDYWLLVEKQRFGSPGLQIKVAFDNARLTFTGVEETVPEWHTPPELRKDTDA